MEKLVQKEAELKDLENSQRIHSYYKERVWSEKNTKNVAKGFFNKMSKPSQQNPRAIG